MFFNDSMWHFISDKISQTIDSEFICDTAKQVHQQHFHSAFILKGYQRRFFVKIIEQPSALDNIPNPLESERQGLELFTDIQAIKVPRVICSGICHERDKDFAFLVMQYVAFKQPSAPLWELAGTQLANHHKTSIEFATQHLSGQYGWSSNNVIGRTLQTNTTTQSWADFFVQYRLEDLARQHSAMGKLLTDNILNSIHKTLSYHSPDPCLLHGDMWSGNIGFDAKQPVIFDPAIWIGDRECDLAMATLFGGFAKSFFEQYESQWPLPDGASQRRLIYQLHPIMNHVLMYGGGYLDQLADHVQRIRQH